MIQQLCSLVFTQELKNFVVVQLLSRVGLFVTPWTAAYQTPLSFTTSRLWLKFMSIESVKLMSTQKPAQHMFITVLFIIDKAWKQPRCSSIGEWIKKLQCIQSMEYYSVSKRNELASHEKLQYILLSERSQSEKASLCMIPTM